MSFQVQDLQASIDDVSNDDKQQNSCSVECQTPTLDNDDDDDVNTTAVGDLWLPDDVLGEIFLHLPLSDIYAILTVNKYVNTIADRESQWMRVHHEHMHQTTKIDPEATWKENVKIRAVNCWSPYLIDCDEKKHENPFDPVISNFGKTVHFKQGTSQGARSYRMVQMTKPVPTRGKIQLDFRVKLRPDDFNNKSYLSSNYLLIGIVDERILTKLYQREYRQIYMGEFPEYENIAYANNGFYCRCSIQQWSSNYQPNDVISVIIDANDGYEAAERSNWEKPYGSYIAGRNGQFNEELRYHGIFKNPEARLYVSLQVNEKEDADHIEVTIANYLGQTSANSSSSRNKEKLKTTANAKKTKKQCIIC